MHKKVLLTQRPVGMATNNDFSLEETELPSLQANEVKIKINFISLDPAMRGWMNEGTTYIKGVELNTVMRAFAIGEVVESQNTNFAVGDWATGLLGVQNYYVGTTDGLQKITNKTVKQSFYLGLLGMPGLTAYFGLLDKGKPIAGDTVLVSGAAGMVGSLVGQISKIKDCKTVGIAGGKEKCNYLLNELGFDEAIDYKTENVAKTIYKNNPKGIQVYFDNVGGEILDAALLNLGLGARVVVCGAISQYNEGSFNGLKNYMKIVSARGTLSGIIVLDYFHRAQEAITDIGNWYAQGKIHYREHIVNGLENFADTLNLLYTGGNNGKLLIAL
jgi:NADPH-dependent curcumin reductase